PARCSEAWVVGAGSLLAAVAVLVRTSALTALPPSPGSTSSIAPPHGHRPLLGMGSLRRVKGPRDARTGAGGQARPVPTEPETRAR
ncbi:hypothetical protein NGM37_44330, partial [Streptomyces sp. TRM76130]|nr:hypothetical protein [Streptomyces sp. TRM76130]